MAWLKFLAPVGKIMNSCIAIPFPPCFPPLITFNAGHGKTNLVLLVLYLVKDLKCWYNGTFLDAAAALATAKETAKIAFAPNLFLHHPY